jgi:hypothetical protein
MRTIKPLFNQVQSILADLEKINAKIGRVPFKEYYKDEQEIYNRVEKLSENAGPGLVPGKHLQFGVADGYAHYVVMSVRKRTVTVEHLPFADKYHFTGCYLDEKRNELVIPTQVAQGALRWEEWRRSLGRK